MFGRIDGGYYSCDSERVEIYMPSFNDSRFGVKYYENFIAALPGAVLLYEAFTFLESVMLTGYFPKNEEVGVMAHYDRTNVDYFKNSI